MMEPIPKDLKTKRHRALIQAIDDMCNQMRREVSDPSWFDETEVLWTDEFFRGARCDSMGLNIRVQLSLSPASSGPYGRRTEVMCDVAIDREIFADTSRRDHEHREILMENMTPGPNKAGNNPK